MWRMNQSRCGVASSGPTNASLVGVWTTSVSYCGSPVVWGDRVYATWGYSQIYLSCYDARTGSNSHRGCRAGSVLHLCVHDPVKRHPARTHAVFASDRHGSTDQRPQRTAV